MRQSESVEMYLETIFVLQRRKPSVRAIDITEALGYSKASVSIAVKRLKENGYLAVSGDGDVLLTEIGKEIAENTYKKHQVLKDLLLAVGMEHQLAEETACRMEHGASMELIEVISHALEQGELDKRM